MLPNAILSIDGKISKPKNLADTAIVSAYDRSFLYGDSLYEVVRTYNQRFLFMEEHLARLEKSAVLCRLKISQGIGRLEDEMRAALKVFYDNPVNQGVEAYCRVVLSRGAGKIGFAQKLVETPTTSVVIVQKLEPPTAELFEKGYSYRVVERFRNDPRALTAAMKSGNYLNSVLAFLEGTEDRSFGQNVTFDDALMCNFQGHVTEGTTFNVFYVKNKTIVTAPLDIGILDGITRATTLALARSVANQNGWKVVETRFPKERFYEADEVFMTSTVKEVFPVTRVDHKVISNGKPGPITRELARLFKKEIERLLS